MAFDSEMTENEMENELQSNLFAQNRTILTLGDELFGSKEITRAWLDTPNYYFLFIPPRHVLISGNGNEVIKYLCHLLLTKNLFGFEKPDETSTGVF